uniref:TPX2 C-terminal domain-containing protein n=1 Tax=Tetraselmis chuii TaxID=63592 RepID=A0A7S1X9W0_9CHLO|mmetsp:Transcript_5133/g.9332  ORF Transcript_5133/g.9332 Transcript_5133/m.9332 type:complete len:649 (+) Transcript_5133:217-2163(+)|eukprot:CAMPEP_0177780670 /NCGR_PEP_ID=MMETSP0491_2-20121128/17364_1 /TAXON_ID=63592 /ORGANISM="Tetraselmis chuii, Strain PLY429" /LENGTH=648 /DNA_ID=CAMNT_0019300531 /DNA_START=180 /DNA_END=2126 /DNA_ORIENTATION=+
MVHVEGSPAGVDAARKRSTLVKVLKQSTIDNDIVADVADACEIKEYTILHLADSQLSVETLAQELYLTVEEAARVHAICVEEVARLGLTLLPDGELPSPIDEEDGDDEADVTEGVTDAATEDLAARFEQQVAMEREEAAFTPAEATTEADIVEKPVENGALDKHAVEAPTVEAAAPTTPIAGPGESDESASQEPTSYPTAVTPTPVKIDPEAEETPSSSTPPAPAPTPVTTNSSKAARPVSASPASRRGAAGKASAKPPASPMPVNMPRPMSAPPKHTPTANLPSYARPTAAAMKKVREEQAEATNMKARPGSASVNISSSLLRPTAASKAWSAGNSDKVRSRLTGSTSDLNASMHELHKGPTMPKPFNLRAGGSAKKTTMSTDELQVAKAKADMAALKDKRARAAKYASAPPKVRSGKEVPRTPTEFKPFALTSTSLHERAQTIRQMQLEEEARKEQEARRFRARPVLYNRQRTYTDVVSSVEERLAKSKKHTVATAPMLSSQQRSAVHKALEEEKRAREAESAVAAAAEATERSAAEEEEMKRMRRALQFHAQAMPDFSAPFKPDLTHAAAPTVAITPRFQTDQRASTHQTESSGESTLDSAVPIADNFNFFASTLRTAEPQKTSNKKNGAKGGKVVDVKVDVTAA